MRCAPIIAIALLAASCSEPAPLITVTEARIIALPSNAAAYFTLTNSGGDDRLLAVEAPDLGTATLHETSMDGGIMRMRAIEGGMPVKRGAKLQFSPYGRHVMIALGHPTDAKAVKLRFTFERQGLVSVDAPITTPDGETN